jgi:ubiquinone/menaquinone biosynthesis C-methylase UbiE
MSNDDVYATGLLTRALDPATQPPEIRAYLRAEFELLEQLVTEGMRVIDVGCGTGRHLLRLKDSLGLGLGVDYEHRYVVEAARRAGNSRLLFITCDATAIPISSTFDLAVCLTNTWGTISDKIGVMREMSSPRGRFYSPTPQ